MAVIEPGAPAAGDEEVRLTPRRDARVGPYAALALVLIGLGLLVGRVEPVAVGAAVAAVSVWSVGRAAVLSVRVIPPTTEQRIVVGEAVRTVVHLDLPSDAEISVDASGASPHLGTPVCDVTTTAPGRVAVGIETTPERWGRYRLGELVVRATAPGGMIQWEGPVVDLGRVTVLPTPDRVDAILAPPASTTTAGVHRSGRSSGDGAEFSELREWVPGDRLRDVNWKVSARRPTPHVNRRHPQRAGDVVIVLDAVPDLGQRQSAVGAAVLQRMGQAAWALARNHLAGQDRVGLLVPYGGRIAWLPPRTGARARYLILDQLMRSVEPYDAAVGETPFHGSIRPDGILRREDVPPSALVIALSTLADQATLTSLAALRLHGRTTCALAFDSSAEVARHTSLDHETVQLGRMVFEARAAYLRRMSTPVVIVDSSADIGRTVDRVAELVQRSGRRGGAG